ncbi:hypothetical protein ACGF4C_12690 [Streptomyces sp. NPDC048197]
MNPALAWHPSGQSPAPEGSAVYSVKRPAVVRLGAPPDVTVVELAALRA